MDVVGVRVRAEPASVDLVHDIVRYYAGIYGLGSEDTNRFLVVIEEAMSQVISYGFPGNPDAMFDVALRIEGTDLIVAITDKGVPYDYESLSADGEAEMSVRLLKGFADGASLTCIGSGGREQVLSKHLSTLPAYERKQVPESEEACGLGPEDIDFHMLRREEAIEVAQCIYDEFGYTYPHDMVYYPDRFFDAVQRGECVSMVATAPNGEVAGHAAMVASPDLPGTMEMCMAVVKRKFRNCSIMNRMSAMLIDHARAIGLASVNAMPVIYHVFTQKICNKQGMSPCGFFFNIINEDLSTSYEQGFRPSLGLAEMMFSDARREIFARPEAAPICRYVVSAGSLDRTVSEVDGTPETSGEAYVKASMDPATQTGKLFIDASGPDIASKLKAMDHYLRSQKCKAIMMYISCNDPGSVLAYDAAVSLGYRCTGLFAGCSDHDRLMMESVPYSTVNYAAIETIDPFTGLLDLVKERDPDAGA